MRSSTCPPGQPLNIDFGGMYRLAAFLWKWSVPHRNSHRQDDNVYAAVWGIKADQESIRSTLHAAFPSLARDELPLEEEDVRRFLRDHFPPPSQASGGSHLQHRITAMDASGNAELERQETLDGACEEAWEHIPVRVRHTLAALNALNLERKLQLILREGYHCSAGQRNLARSSAAVSKTLWLWRLGFGAAVGTWERTAVRIYFVLLAFMACYPDVSAGLLGERSYNQRSIGSRIFTLIQLFFLWTFPYHSLWLLFNWSLERLLGALVGNLIYAVAAMVPSVHASYDQTWMRAVVLALSISWQVSVQFAPALRDYTVRLLTRRQILAMRKRSKTEGGIDWDSVDARIQWELVSHRALVGQQPALRARDWTWPDVPIRVRVERYIQFTSLFTLGRAADQLIGLLKDDMESIINTLEDYKPAVHGTSAGGDKGHVEPRMSKFLLVFLDVAIFTYVCYSFWEQPFTFNTVVAYSSVVIVKQTILAMKRYQTIEGARRLFTNMVSVNVLGMLLVSLPVTIDGDVLADTARFVALTLAMVAATLFLAEPIGPILLSLTEKAASSLARLRQHITKK